ncbi:MAG: alpha/beta fold hydrolase [Sphingomonadales bacterium]|nr:alpha/beta fold hydrolase [Sphingomonadales bacterium]MDE2171720.1 alpha/beta fold hydrolase [Sphingomonadales bacterium]
MILREVEKGFFPFALACPSVSLVLHEILHCAGNRRAHGPVFTPAFGLAAHVIAPDYIGFGQSDAPPATAFSYTFENLTDHVDALLDQLGRKHYVLYIQDYGGPIAMRLFTRHPQRVAGLVVQNANAYLEGVGDLPKRVFLPLWKERNATTEGPARHLLAADTTRFQYGVGVRNEAAISPGGALDWRRAPAGASAAPPRSVWRVILPMW